MSSKRLTVRFDLENKRDRRVWEFLQSESIAKSAAVIIAVDAYYSQKDWNEVIRQTIRECFQGVPVNQDAALNLPCETTAEDLTLFDSMTSFMGL